MPIVEVQMLQGRTDEQKRLLIAELTRVMTDVAGADADRVNVVIHEVGPDCWGRGGLPLGEQPAAAEEEPRAAV